MKRAPGDNFPTGTFHVGDILEDDGHSHLNERIHTEIRYDDGALKELNDQLADSKKQIGELIQTTEESFSDMRNKMEKERATVRKQIDESKTKVVETLALFAALFTFLSLQVDVLKGEDDTDKILGLVLITGGLITFFVLILDSMVKTREPVGFLKKRFVMLYVMSILLVLAGVLMVQLK